MYRESKVISPQCECIICGETSYDSFVVLKKEEDDYPCIYSGTFMECLLKASDVCLGKG